MTVELLRAGTQACPFNYILICQVIFSNFYLDWWFSHCKIVSIIEECEVCACCIRLLSKAAAGSFKERGHGRQKQWQC
jgi:hypothetical protein